MVLDENFRGLAPTWSEMADFSMELKMMLHSKPKNCWDYSPLEKFESTPVGRCTTLFYLNELQSFMRTQTMTNNQCHWPWSKIYVNPEYLCAWRHTNQGLSRTCVYVSENNNWSALTLNILSSNDVFEHIIRQSIGLKNDLWTPMCISIRYISR